MKTGSDKQELFIAAYNGDIKEAAKKSGLSYGYCRVLLTKPHIIKRIRRRNHDSQQTLIADRQARQRFWSDIMTGKLKRTITVKSKKEGGKSRNKKVPHIMTERLKASELLGKSERDFIMPHEHSGPNGTPIVFSTASDLSDADLEKIINEGSKKG